MYDLIGDIHGHADELVQLLDTLGYNRVRGSYCHPERKVIFLGDFIDRGPQIRQVLEIVRPMVELEHAVAVMGNHELNALAYHTEDWDVPGRYLRCRSQKNEKQHRATLDQLPPPELRSHLEWFRRLPLWLDLDDRDDRRGLRVVHACWDTTAVETIKNANQAQAGMTAEFLHLACRRDKSLFAPVETMLKGREGKLPAGASFLDKDGHVRTEIRTRWYMAADAHTYRTYALQSDEIACDLPLDLSVIDATVPYPTTAKPVFVGHYWLSGERPQLLAANVACLDYSVAKGGLLCAYRWNGELQLSNDNFVWVKARK